MRTIRKIFAGLLCMTIIVTSQVALAHNLSRPDEPPLTTVNFRVSSVPIIRGTTDII